LLGGHLLCKLARFYFALHVPLPLVDLGCFEADLARQGYNFLLAPVLVFLELSCKQLVLVRIFAETALHFGSLALLLRTGQALLHRQAITVELLDSPTKRMLILAVKGICVRALLITQTQNSLLGLYWRGTCQTLLSWLTLI
jgi:hypothetical protein